jgi:phage/plasmid-like protein (TIGR03299 family)
MTATDTIAADAAPETDAPETLIIPDTSTRQLAWAGISTGSALDGETLTSEQMIERAGLGWEVGIRPLYRHMNDGTTLASESLETYRMDTEAQIGTVKSRYEPLQNREVFAFGDAVVEQGLGRWVDAGLQKNGARVFMTMKLAEQFQVLGRDPFDLYLFLSAGHDGGRSITAFETPIRVSCLNQMNAVQHNHMSRYSIQHTTSMRQRLEDARLAISHGTEFIAELQKSAEKLAKTQLTDRKARNLIEGIVPQTRSRRDEVVNDILTVYASSPTIEGYRGTAYGLLNGVTEYMDHVKRQNNGNARFESVFFGEGAKAQRKLLAALN